MKTFTVEVIIQNKPAARDPEGETIRKDLIFKGGYKNVKSVRTGKYLKILVEAPDRKQAEKTVFDLCNTLRIYNPVVHTHKIFVRSNKK